MHALKQPGRGLAALGLALAFAFGAPALYAAPQGHHHDHGAATQGALKLDEGRKWPTDAPLRAGMIQIRDAIATAPHAVHAGTADAAAYAALAKRVEAEVATIVAQCKLPPEADAQLHLVIADLMTGADRLKAAKGQVEGVRQIARALDNYGTYFQHPGWKPLEGH